MNTIKNAWADLEDRYPVIAAALYITYAATVVSAFFFLIGLLWVVTPA